MRKFLLVCALAGAMLGSVFAQAAKPVKAALPAARNAEAITAAEMRDYLFFVASDEMEGRNTPSRGLDLTAKFIAMNLSRWGVKSGGDNGSYFQYFSLVRRKFDNDQTNIRVGEKSFKLNSDFYILDGVKDSLSGSLVYVGDGWMVKAKNRNPYSGVDVRDKIMVVSTSFRSRGRPADITDADLGGKKGEDWADPEEYAKTHGAKGIILTFTGAEYDNWNAFRRFFGGGNNFRLDASGGDGSDVPTLIASKEMMEAMFASEAKSGAEVLAAFEKGVANPSFALTKPIAVNIKGEIERAKTQNVVGIIEGNDPVLKNEYVAIGSHYDHVGIGGCGGQTPTDNICNGADDDGSGTVAMLNLARAFAISNPRPKRSILLVWHAGEEKGLWGSEYYVEHPTVPLNKIVTQLNIDMIGRSKQVGDTNRRNANLTGPKEIYIIGSKLMSTELGALSERVNASYLNLTFNYKYDDPNDTERLFYRSDHYNYAKKGIPIIFYFDGVHEDYHQAGDHPDKIDYQKMELVTRTIFMTGWELANQAKRPTVDKKLDR
jgi:hypothetical protein